MHPDDIKELVTSGDKRSKKPGSKLAKRFAELIQEGKTPKTAANLLKVNLADPKNYDIRGEVEGLLRGFAMKPEVAKEVVRAARNKILVESMGIGGGEKNYDLALNAAKQISGDPDVGLNAPPAPLVQLSFNTIEDLLGTLDERDVVIDARPAEEPVETVEEPVTNEEA